MAITKEQIIKAIQRNQLIDMMYTDKSGKITKRRIKVTSVSDNSFSAYCFARRAKRTFKFGNVLADIRYAIYGIRNGDCGLAAFIGV